MPSELRGRLCLATGTNSKPFVHSRLVNTYVYIYICIYIYVYKYIPLGMTGIFDTVFLGGRQRSSEAFCLGV